MTEKLIGKAEQYLETARTLADQEARQRKREEAAELLRLAEDLTRSKARY